MADVRYRLAEGLSPEQIERMHDEALGLIERVGLRVEHAPTLRRLAGQTGVRIDGSQVRFRGDLMEQAILAQVYPAEATEGAFAINSGAYELNVTDLDTGAVRPSTYRDLVDLTGLANS